MKKLKIAKRVLSFMTCSAISIGILAAYPLLTDKSEVQAAKTLQEIQEQRKANSEKIAALENKINDLEGDKNYEKQQQEYLNEQIDCIQENIDLLNAELNSISADIETTETNITLLDADIVNQQTAIDTNIELFKERLCSMYMNSNDSAASMVLGSTSFYDMMARVQMINRVAEYDDKLINDILNEIEALEQSKKDLESEKLNLTMKLEDQEKRKEEKTDEIEQLNVKMKDTQYEIERLALEQESLNADKDELEELNKALDAEEAEMVAAIERERKAAQERYEAEQRRKWEEQQKLLQQQQQANNNNAGVGGGDNPAPVTPSVPNQPTYTPSAPSASGFTWPCPGFSYISSPFGPRWGRNHNGIDVGDGGIMGGAAVASKAGTVIYVANSCTHNFAKNYSCGCGGGYGNYIIISHDGTYSTVYAHLSYASVSVGDYVEQNQVIGAIGSTGHSTGAHLHFEIRENGVAQNPMNYVGP